MTWDEYWLRTQIKKPGYGIAPGSMLPTVSLEPDIPEGALLAAIRKLAASNHWEAYHTHDSRKSPAGFPDLALCNGHSLLLYELKNATEHPTKAQQHWLALLATTTRLESGLWRPADWEAIVRRLEAP